MARRIGVQPESIINWILGRMQPRISVCPKIIEFLGYNPFTADTSTLGGRIKMYRIQHGLSQKCLAALSGLDEISICQWEKNDKTPLPNKLKKLEKIVNSQEHSF